jgi:hypothetical protein
MLSAHQVPGGASRPDVGSPVLLGNVDPLPFRGGVIKSPGVIACFGW